MSWQQVPITRSYDGLSYTIMTGTFPTNVYMQTLTAADGAFFTEVANFWAALPEGDPKKLTAPAVIPPTDTEIMAKYTTQVTSRLTNFAVTRGYEGILDCISYYHSSRVQKASDAAYMVTARDATMLVWEALAKDVEDGIEAVPATWAAVEAQLPTLAWPN